MLAWLAADATGTDRWIQFSDTVGMPLTDIIAKGLPVLCVETIDGEEPTCDYVSAPPGCMGMTITNATKVPGRLVIYRQLQGTDSLIYDSGDYENNVSGMTIKIRGNTSAYADKKPYKIKLQHKCDLLMRGDDNKYKDKDWLLLKDPYLLTLAGFTISQMLGMTWTPAHAYVNVVINGEYRGVYLLCESVKRNPDCRIDVDKATGYIFECDPYWWNEDVYVSSITSPSYNFTFKYPDSDDVLPEQQDYLQRVVAAYERSLSASDYPDLIDVPSWARWCLAHDVCGTKDSGGANRYYSKRDSTDSSRVEMPVLWDFDMAERTSSDWSWCHTEHFAKLFSNANRAFVDEYVWQWRRVRGSLEDDMYSAMTDFRRSDQGKALESSYDLEAMRWGGYSPSLLSQVYVHIRWCASRRAWLDDAIDALNPVGDVNVDGKVEIQDVTLLIDMLLGSGGPVYHAADVNGDGTASIADVSMLIDLLLSQG